MTEYVMVDRELIGKVSASLHDYKDGAPWGAFDLSALMELDDILAAPQQAAEPMAILCREIGETTWFDHTPIRPGTTTHMVRNSSPEWDTCEVYAGHPPAQPEQHKSQCLKCNDTGCYPLGSSCLCDHRQVALVPEQPAPIPTCERLPTKADADWMGFIYAFASDGSGWGLWEWIHVADDPDYLTHWLPTGLTRPAEPGGE
jgi:hypothetical protein